MNSEKNRDVNLIQEIGLWPTLFLKLESHRILLLRLVVAVGVLVFTVGVSLVLSLKNPLYGAILAALPFGIAAFFMVQSRLYLAPVLILAASAYVPFSLPTGTGSRLVISLILSIGFLFLWWFRRAVIEKNFKLVRTPATLPVFGFAVTIVISFAWSVIFRDPLLFVPNSFIFVQAASGVIMIASPLMLLLVANLVQEVKYLKGMVWLMISVGAFGFISNMIGGRLPVNTAGLASMWIVGFALSMAVFDQKLTKIVRLLLGLLALLWIYWGFVLNLSWVSGWLPCFVIGGIILFFRSKKLLAFSVLLLAVYIFSNTGIIEQWFGDESVTSGDTRLLAWQMNWRFTSQHLIFGMGPAGYAVYYMTYYPLDAMATHNNYIDLISETGVVGTVFYFWIFGVLIWRGLVVIDRVRGRRDFIEALAISAFGGTIGCIVIMAFGDWLLPFAYTQTISGYSYTVYSWIFMGTTLALDLITGRESFISTHPGSIETPVRE